jgi:hypothetical protein
MPARVGVMEDAVATSSSRTRCKAVRYDFTLMVMMLALREEHERGTRVLLPCVAQIPSFISLSYLLMTDDLYVGIAGIAQDDASDGLLLVPAYRTATSKSANARASSSCGAHFRWSGLEDLSSDVREYCATLLTRYVPILVTGSRNVMLL